MSATNLTSNAAAPALAAVTTDRERGKRSRRRRINATLIAGLVLLGLIAAFSAFYPMTNDWSQTEPDFAQPTFANPSWTHPLGTDNFGRDTLTRIAYGGRVDLIIAFVATAVTVIVGGLIGLMSGYFGGWLDTILMRFVDFMITIPYLILVIALVAVLGVGVMSIIYAVWIIGWVTYARIVRGETMVVRKLEYIEAARVVGMSNARIIFRHVLPNVVAIALIYSMGDIVLNILLAASLSFLGLGVQPPHAEWGLMVSESRDFFLRDWQMMTYPGLVIIIAGAAFGLIGDGLAQALRPKG
jgi:peptide/nickel transport system permease protein